MKSARNHKNNITTRKVMSILEKMGLCHHHIEAVRHTVALLQEENKKLLNEQLMAIDSPDKDLYWRIAAKRWDISSQIIALEAKYHL